MTVNKADNQLPDRLTNKIGEIERELSALKTRQKFGGDNLVFDWSGTATGSFTIANGSYQNFIATLTSLITGVPLFPLYLINVYIGTLVVDETRRWPAGSALTPAEKGGINVTTYVSANDTSGDAQSWAMQGQVQNNTGATSNFCVQIVWRFPRLQTS